MINKKPSGKALAIQISDGVLRAARLTLGAAPKIENCSVYELPEGAVTDGFINDRETVESVMRTVGASEAYAKLRKVVFSLCTTQIITELASIPANTDKRAMDKLLRTNMDLYFPVDTTGYNLVWQIVGESESANGKELSVQLWAVPEELLAPYYAAANACGYSVAGIDYCGMGVAAAAGLDFAAPQDKAAPQDEASQETKLVVWAEGEHMLMTFAQNNAVKLQRMFLTGGDDLGEALMVLEYFRSSNYVDESGFTCSVCGANAADDAFVERLHGELDLPVSILTTEQGPEWCACYGAGCMTVDFGNASLDHPQNTLAQFKNSWQLAVLVGGAAIFVLAIVLTIASKLIWSGNISDLENSLDNMRQQSLKSAGFADNYYEYEELYDAYSGDWDMMFNSLRTYNDNLVLMFDELQGILPKSTRVETIGIATEGLALEFSCPNKEEAAYLIIALRQLEYADLDAISDLTLGKGYTAQDMLPSLAAKLAAEAAAAAEAAGESGGEDEEPPTTGASTPIDLDHLKEILDLAGATGKTDKDDPDPTPSPTPTPKPSEKPSHTQDPAPTPTPKQMSDKELEEALWTLSLDQLDDVEEKYGKLPSVDKSSSQLIKEATKQQRKNAISNMLNNDQIAQARFVQLFKEDANKSRSKQILFPLIASDLYENTELVKSVSAKDIEKCKAAIPDLVEILIKNDKNLAATEKLIMTNQKADDRYAYYLAVELGLMKKDDNADKLDDKVKNDDVLSKGDGEDLSSSDLAQKLLDIVLDAGDSGIKDMLDRLNRLNNKTGTTTGSTNDGRIHFAVALGYKDSLIDSELERKGLSYPDKLEKLEVD